MTGADVKYKNIADLLTVFLRDDMEGIVSEVDCEVRFRYTAVDVELEVITTGYTESWNARNLSELNDLIPKYPTGM